MATPSHFPSPLGPALEPLLKRLGLDERETAVYLALLRQKIGRASAVAKMSGQSRSHTYLVLRSLEEKGLVSEVDRGGVLHFVAESPQRLLRYVEEREQELKSLKPLVEGALPFLQSLGVATGSEPRVTKLKGLDGMKQVYRDILTQEFVGMLNPQAMYDTFGRTVADVVFRKGEISLRGRDLLVDNVGAMRYMQEWPPSEDYRVRLLPKTIVFRSDTLVYGETIALFSFDSENTVVQIENASLANTFRVWFEALWELSREP